MNCVCLCKAVNRSPSNKDTCIGNQYIWLIYWQYIDNNFAGDIKKQTLLIFILLFILVLQLSMSVYIEMIHNVRLFLKKKVSYVHQGYMYLIKKYCKIVLLWNIIAKKKNGLVFWKFWNIIYFCTDKVEFLAAITPVFSVTWSFRNLNMLVWCLKNISDIFKFQCCAYSCLICI